MDTPNIIAVGILVVAAIALIGIRVYKSSKEQNKPITFDDFIKIYGDQIIKILQDTIVILQININEFPNREEYEKAIISITITKLTDNAKEFGIDPNIVKLFDADALTDVVYTVLHKNPVEIFSCLTPKQVDENKELYEDEVAAALVEAE